MRLFVAAELPREARQRIESLLVDLAREARDVRWVKGASVHLTLKFLGEVDSSRVPSISAALEPVARALAAAISVRIRGLGVFGSRGNPRVVWIGVEEESPALAPLAAAVDLGLASIGFAREDRPFRPHLTLARPKAPSRALDASVASRAAADLGRFDIRAMALFESLLRPEGAEYVLVADFPFGAAAERAS